MGRIPAVLRNYITWPLLCTLVMLLWTAAVSPYTKYGDDWAAIPVEVIFIVAVVLHLFIIVKERWRPLYLFYAAVHVPFSFIVGTFCLMLITKSWFGSLTKPEPAGTAGFRAHSTAKRQNSGKIPEEF